MSQVSRGVASSRKSRNAQRTMGAVADPSSWRSTTQFFSQPTRHARVPDPEKTRKPCTVLHKHQRLNRENAQPGSSFFHASPARSPIGFVRRNRRSLPKNRSIRHSPIGRTSKKPQIVHSFAQIGFESQSRLDPQNRRRTSPNLWAAPRW